MILSTSPNIMMRTKDGLHPDYGYSTIEQLSTLRSVGFRCFDFNFVDYVRGEDACLRRDDWEAWLSGVAGTRAPSPPARRHQRNSMYPPREPMRQESLVMHARGATAQAGSPPKVTRAVASPSEKAAETISNAPRGVFARDTEPSSQVLSTVLEKRIRQRSPGRCTRMRARKVRVSPGASCTK